MTRVLVLETALADAFAALVEDGAVVAERRVPGGRGLVERLPSLVDGLVAGVDLIATIVGPGSFTGIRAGLALAHGLSFGLGCPVVGVTVGEAVRAAFGDEGLLWVVTDAQSGRLHVEGDGAPRSAGLADLAPPDAELALGGDMAEIVMSHLASLGGRVRMAPCPLPDAPAIARAGLARLAGRLAARDSLPLYIDAPRTGGLATARLGR